MALSSFVLSEYRLEWQLSEYPRPTDRTNPSTTRVAGVKPRYACSMCDKTFSTLFNRKAHENLHAGIKPFGCGECGRSFSRKHHLENHMNSFHNIHKQIQHIGGVYPISSLAWNLTRRVEQNPLRPRGSSPSARQAHVCEICHKHFSCSGNLRTHEKLHTGIKPFVCPICGKAFSQISSAELRHQCHQCGRYLPSTHSLTIHIRSHSGERPFQCPVCQKCFSDKSNLRRHMRTMHFGIKPYQCPKCNKTYSDHSNMKKHVERCDGKDTCSF
ncbi:vascular endothelial zinc finger 1-like [Tubulanus polymorphus]|uniref:vascular endothelial zinc finger 1-like n=1 Tax=Tubulanus polymorphus TaxID=672921 RepID=UPI003DA223C1